MKNGFLLIEMLISIILLSLLLFLVYNTVGKMKSLNKRIDKDEKNIKVLLNKNKIIYLYSKDNNTKYKFNYENNIF